MLLESITDSRVEGAIDDATSRASSFYQMRPFMREVCSKAYEHW
jgi:hypothetical protein